jgi:hypothetical protein
MHKPDWERVGRVGESTKYVCHITEQMMVTILVQPNGETRYWATGLGCELTPRRRMLLVAALSGVGRPGGSAGGK